MKVTKFLKTLFKSKRSSTRRSKPKSRRTRKHSRHTRKIRGGIILA